jgi:hypothetical protein
MIYDETIDEFQITGIKMNSSLFSYLFILFQFLNCCEIMCNFGSFILIIYLSLSF